jgi:hypothetical protein
MDGLLRRRWFWLGVAVPAAMVVVAAVVGVAGHCGTDCAAHAYKVELARRGGGLLWDDMWYGGTYGAAQYGVVYYTAAAVVGEGLLVVIAAAVLPLLFWSYLRGIWRCPGLLPPLALAVMVALALPTGEYPFIVGLALCLGGAALLAARRPLTAALPVACALFVNPLAVVFVAIFLVADYLCRPTVRRGYRAFAAAVAIPVLVRLAMLRVFSQPAVELDQLVPQLKVVAMGLVAAALVALSGDPDRRAKATVFLVAAAVSAGAWLAPHNPVGNTDGRFFAIFGIPLLLTLRPARSPAFRPLAGRRLGTRGSALAGAVFRPLTIAAVIAAIVACAALSLPLSAISGDFGAPGPPQSAFAAFFAPAVRWAVVHGDPGHRIDVVALQKHWEAYFFPLAGVPLTRGWYRQSDAIHNAAVDHPVSPSRYAAWLRDEGVRYIFVPHAALDRSTLWEVRDLACSRLFVRVAQPPGWVVYRSRLTSPLVTPRGADVVSYGPASLVVDVRRPGDYVVKVTWSPYWVVSGGPGTVAQGPRSWTVLRAPARGRYELRLRVTAAGVLRELL